MTWEYHEDREQGVEFRYRPGRLEFRLTYNDNPRSYNEVLANAHLRDQGGAWVIVPPHMESKVPRFWTGGSTQHEGSYEQRVSNRG